MIVRHQADSLIRMLRGARATRYAEDSTSLGAIPDVVQGGRFWIIQARRVDATVSRLLAIGSVANVTYVRPVNAGEPPPDCPDGVTDTRCPDDNPFNDISDGIETIGALDWKTTSYAQGWIGVLDTGVYSDHLLLKDIFDSRVNVFQCELECPTDCPDDFSKCTDCPTGNSGDLCEEGHGTATAGILIGQNEEWPDQEGMTRASIDWFTVYDKGDCEGDCDEASTTPTLNACAAIRGIEFAVRRGNPVLIAEVAAVADDDDEQDPIDQAAAHAFEAGTAVIAAAGNGPRGQIVLGPAREATVIGVGGRYLTDWTVDAEGPAQRYGDVDGRYKPEILGPTKLEAPSRCSDHAFTYFSYTSGATPYVGAAASVLNEWLASTAKVTDAGNTYAQLIVSGTLTGAFSNDRYGVGLLNIAPLSSLSWAGKTELSTGEEDRIDLPNATDDLVTIEAAIWWPEVEKDGSRPHHWVRLELLDANGVVVETSDDNFNVFQRISVPRTALGDLPSPRWQWRSFTLFCFFGWCFRISFPVLVTQPWSIRLTELTEMDEGEVQTVYWTVVGRR